jgi:hypothetical protein
MKEEHRGTKVRRKEERIERVEAPGDGGFFIEFKSIKKSIFPMKWFIIFVCENIQIIFSSFLYY